MSVFLHDWLNSSENGGGGNRTRETCSYEWLSRAKSWVYFVQAGSSSGPVKIGITNNLETRLHTLQVGNHRRLRYIAHTQFEKDRAQRVESILHGRLARHLILGEWFKPHAEVLEASRNPTATVLDALVSQERYLDEDYRAAASPSVAVPRRAQ